MNDPEHEEEARRWIRYALEDLSEAELQVERSESVPRHACWLSKQAVEKVLKSILVFLQIPFPRKHDLDALRNLIPEGWSVKESFPDLAELTEWAVEAHPLRKQDVGCREYGSPGRTVAGNPCRMRTPPPGEWAPQKTA
jgi:HEPN domain-containing protein